MYVGPRQEPRRGPRTLGPPVATPLCTGSNLLTCLSAVLSPLQLRWPVSGSARTDSSSWEQAAPLTPQRPSATVRLPRAWSAVRPSRRRGGTAHSDAVSPTAAPPLPTPFPRCPGRSRLVSSHCRQPPPIWIRYLVTLQMTSPKVFGNLTNDVTKGIW